MTPPPTVRATNGRETSGSEPKKARAPRRTKGEHEKAVEKFVAEAGDRLTALDAPAVAAFKALAKELDTHFLAATAAQFGLQHRHLLKRLASDEATPDDDDDDLLTPR